MKDSKIWPTRGQKPCARRGAERRGRVRSGVWRDACVTAALLLLATAVCYVLSRAFDDNNPFASSVYILAVALVSFFTAGYAYGIAASVVSVFCVNYMFTYPFWRFDMALYGYPLTFLVMLVVSVLISALTTRIKRQEALKREAEREKLRANLLRSISHDIRTPLSAIVGSSSTLLADAALSEADIRALAEEINRGAQWLVRLVENILTVTRLSGGVQLETTDEVMEEVVGSAIGRFRKLYGGLPVRVVKPEEILFVPMNAGLVEQVLFNLLQNIAMHAPSATQAVIDIHTGDGCAVCSVSDNGGGVAADMLAHVFDGYRAAEDGLCADGTRGMGIGLSVCKSIVTAHGGMIRAENNAEGGATFTFTLPLKEA